MNTRVNKHGRWPFSGLPTVAILLVLAWNVSLVRAQVFSRMVSFGDSLSDTGNIYDATSNWFNALVLAFLFPQLDTPYPQSPYYDGRFSNGPVWVEHLSDQLGLGAVVPSELGGFNYAVGGATTFDDGNVFLNLVLPDDVADQVDDYLYRRTISGGELFIVEGGANDLLSGGVTDVNLPVGNLEGFVIDLYDAGGRNFLVPNLPPLGRIPGEVGGAYQSILNARSAQFNLELSNRLDNLVQTLPGITIHRVNFHAGLTAVLEDPGTFGLSNVTGQAFNPVTNQVVPNPDQYLFWDNIHPTASAHWLLGSLAADVILNPATCDLDANNTCDLADVNTMFGQGDLVAGVIVGVGNPSDLNKDLRVDGTDLDLWLALAATENGYASPYLRGDTDGLNNLSPVVRDIDLIDYNSLIINFDSAGLHGPFGWDDGDTDGDGDVDLADYNALAGNFSTHGYVATANSVPEPSSGILILWGLALGTGVAICRKRVFGRVPASTTGNSR